MFTWLRRWWRGKRSPEFLEVVMYTRRGCHLCDDAWALLQAEQSQWGFALTCIDVDGDGELQAQHGECVPVVMVNGRVRFRGRVDRVLLRRLLRGESGA
jgi:glutaredoxin